MKKLFIFAFALLSGYSGLRAQSKIFKEVGDEISSTMRTIRQDNSLVGYLVFSKLEKVSEDSFNYRISIIDENLNDLGKVDFKDQDIRIGSVAFEQDVLCINYAKSITDPPAPNEKKNRKKTSYQLYTVLQFLALDGKILNTVTQKVNTKKNYYSSSYEMDRLLDKAALRNISQKGFTFYYNDEDNSYLSFYSPEGKQGWNKQMKTDANNIALEATSDNIFLLRGINVNELNGYYEMTAYAVSDGKQYDNYSLRDKQKNPYQILTMDTDPVTGKPYISGYILNKDRKPHYQVRDYTLNMYKGVFTLNINGPAASDIQEVTSYWDDGSKSIVNNKGIFQDIGAYSHFQQSFKDFEGNTYYTGTSIIKKTKVGAIVSSVVFSPLLVPPIIISGFGYTKLKFSDGMLVKQTRDGNLLYENTIPGNSSSYMLGKKNNGYYSFNKKFHAVSNTDTKTLFIVMDDDDDIFVYNVNKKKVVRTIPHKEGKTTTNIFPAKDGHVLVMEYNRKEKYTKLSIESL